MPQGELLTLHTFDDRNKLAIYKAPASSCNACALKAFCTPHDGGRHVYRSLAEFHETDVGRFHRWLSLIVLGLALAFSGGGLLAWWNKPGECLLVIASCVSVVFPSLGARDSQDAPRGHATADVFPEESWLTSDRVATQSTWEHSLGAIECDDLGGSMGDSLLRLRRGEPTE